MEQAYSFENDIWIYPGKAAWHFINLPVEVAQDIDFYFSMDKKGWGSLPVECRIGTTVWKTSIFPDKKSNSYLLPIKSEVRLQAQIEAGQRISIQITLRSNAK